MHTRNLLVASLSLLATSAIAQTQYAWVGTYNPNGEGVYRFTLDPQTGALGNKTLVSKLPNAAQLTASHDGKTLYVASEVEQGVVQALRVGDNGELSELNQVASGGAGPVYLSLTPNGQHLLVANYVSGSIAVLPIKTDGSLGEASDTHQDRGEPGAAKPEAAAEGSFAISEMTSPLSLVITAFARVEDVRQTITPQLVTEDNALLLIDLGKGNNALGATALAQVYRQLGDKPADVRDVAQLKGFYDAIQALVAQRKLLAYHDRSDGGLLVTLAEMAFTGHCGVEADIATLGADRLAALFNEELGAVIQVRAADRDAVEAVLAQHGLADCVHYLGKAVQGDRFVIEADGHAVFSESRTTLRMWWAETTWQMQRLRDNPECADQEHDAKANDNDPGLNVKLSFDINEDIAAPYIATGARPKVAVLREQGVNSHVEMAAAFHRAGFDAIDVHMSDLLAGRTGLEDFQALVACGGFSYGDVLGAGEGWAKSILFNTRVRDEFETFFHRPTFIPLQA
jgi:hypothetical protein